MVDNDTFRTKKRSIGSVYGFYAKPSLLTQNQRIALNLTCATQNIHNKISLHILRFIIIELPDVMRPTYIKGEYVTAMKHINNIRMIVDTHVTLNDIICNVLRVFIQSRPTIIQQQFSNVINVMSHRDQLARCLHANGGGGGHNLVNPIVTTSRSLRVL